jgi:hypothetical protein
VDVSMRSSPNLFVTDHDDHDDFDMGSEC